MQTNDKKINRNPPWRASAQKRYFYITSEGTVEQGVETGKFEDNARHAIGNYFRAKSSCEIECSLRNFEYKVTSMINELIGYKYNPKHTRGGCYIRICDRPTATGVKIEPHRYSNGTGQRNFWAPNDEILVEVVKKLGEYNFLKYRAGELIDF